MKKCIYFLLAAFLVSCASDKNKVETRASEDSTGISHSQFSTSFDAKTFKTLTLPLAIDTNFIMEVDTNNRIPYQQIRQLGTQLLAHELSDGLFNDINSFCEVDSIKQAGHYADYLAKLEIGMTKIAISFKLGVIDLGEGTQLFIWGIHNSSFEACPYFAGTTIIGTLVNEDKENTHFLLGELSGGGDPPATGTDEVTSYIDKEGTITVRSIFINDDLDIPGEDVTKQTVILKIENGAVTVINSTKSASNGEKQLRDN